MADEITDPIESTEVPEVVPEASVTEPTTASGESTEPVIDWNARITEWGGEEAIEDALAIYNGLADEKGVASLFIQAGRELGLGDREMERFLAGQTAESDDEYERPDPNAVMTRAEFEAELEAKVLAPQRQSAAEQQAAAYQARVEAGVTAGLAAAGVPDDETIGLSVLALANQHLTGDSDAEIARAIQKGWEQFQAAVKGEAVKYSEEKQGDRDNTPNPLTSSGAGAPGGEETKPVSYEEYGSDVLEAAIKRARAKIVNG